MAKRMSKRVLTTSPIHRVEKVGMEQELLALGIPQTFAFPCPELVWTGEIQLIGPIQKWQKHMIMVWVRLNR